MAAKLLPVPVFGDILVLHPRLGRFSLKNLNSRLSPTENLNSERVHSDRPIPTGTPDATQTGPSWSCLAGGVN